MNQPELDYAFLCGYATIHDNSLTVVDASFTRMVTPVLPTSVNFAIAGRVRLDENADETPLSVTINTPGNTMSMELSTFISSDGADKYDGKAGVLFATQIQMPLNTYGLYSVLISLEGHLVRTLKFEVIDAPGSNGEA